MEKNIIVGAITEVEEKIPTYVTATSPAHLPNINAMHFRLGALSNFSCNTLAIADEFCELLCEAAEALSKYEDGKYLTGLPAMLKAVYSGQINSDPHDCARNMLTLAVIFIQQALIEHYEFKDFQRVFSVIDGMSCLKAGNIISLVFGWSNQSEIITLSCN